MTLLLDWLKIFLFLALAGILYEAWKAAREIITYNQKGDWKWRIQNP